jgi:ATP-dependent exoDNAse (exonuclease V) beta subunit
MQAPGSPGFKSNDSVLIRPGGTAPGPSTVCPGLHIRSEFSVVWWDPRVLKLGAEAPLGIRRPELIVKDVAPQIVEAGLSAYNTWRESRNAAITAGSHASVTIQTVTLSAKDTDTAWGKSTLPVEIVELPRAMNRPSGPRFGTLVHAVLATVPLDGNFDAIRDLAAVHGRIIGATPEEITTAGQAVSATLAHSLLHQARDAAKQNRCRREAPIAWRNQDGFLTEGVVDLAFERDQRWIVIDFKTDEDLAQNELVYRRQVGLYALAIEAATKMPAAAVLMRV